MAKRVKAAFITPRSVCFPLSRSGGTVRLKAQSSRARFLVAFKRGRLSFVPILPLSPTSIDIEFQRKLDLRRERKRRFLFVDRPRSEITRVCINVTTMKLSEFFIFS